MASPSQAPSSARRRRRSRPSSPTAFSGGSPPAFPPRKMLRTGDPPPFLGLACYDGFYPAWGPHPSVPWVPKKEAWGWFPQDARDGRVLIHPNYYPNVGSYEYREGGDFFRPRFMNYAVCDPLFNEKLRRGSGSGCGGENKFLATDAWWELNTKGKKELLALKDEIPDHLEEMDKMFTGYVADGSSSYAPDAGKTVQHIPSDEDAEQGEDEDVVHAMLGEVRGLINDLVDNRAFIQDMYSQHKAEKQAAKEAKMEAARKEEEENMQHIMQLARESGVDDNAPEWPGVLKIAKDPMAVTFFMMSAPAGRKRIIERLARDDVAPTTAKEDDDSDEEFDQLMLGLGHLMEAQAAAAAIVAIAGAFCCMEALPGGLRISKLARFHGAFQGDQIPSARVSKRRRTTSRDAPSHLSP